MAAQDPRRPAARKALAQVLFERHQSTQDETAYLEAAGIARELAAEDALDARLIARWGHAVAGRIQQTALGMTPGAGEPHAGGIAALTANEVVSTLLAEDAPGALEGLEEGRALLLSGAFNTRGELDALRAADPGLAAEFTALREEALAALNPGQEASPGEQDRFRERMARCAELVERIKALPGFARFLLPLPLGIAELRPAAAEGPVVAINVHASRCDALALCADGVVPIPLPGLSAADLVAQAGAFETAVGTLTSCPGGFLAEQAQHTVRDTLAWLWEVLAEPVLTRLGFTVTPAEGRDWPRLWWSPTGPLNFLPLHAAGKGAGESVLDRVVSSYTPTLRALLRARSRPAPARRTALAVAMPQTPGQTPLPATVREATALAGRFAGPAPLIGAEATAAAVRAALPGVTIAHFACHASSDPEDVSAARLLLHDGPLDVTEISELDLGSAELAYLSACATARGSLRHANEAVHLASACQLAGYPQVVATLWEVEDEVAATVAAEFHRAVAAQRGRLDGATALHTAVRRVRAAAPERPGSWAAYLHAGA